MLSRILFGCTGILLALFLAPQNVEAGASGDDRLRHSRSVRWTQGGCRVSPRPVTRVLPRRVSPIRTSHQIQYFCIGGVQKRRLPCGTIERWIAPHTRIVTRKVKVPGGFRTEVRYRNECICGITVQVPYTVRVALPARCELKREKVHVPGRWVAEKGRQSRPLTIQHQYQNRF